jgi:hypothetical protein
MADYCLIHLLLNRNGMLTKTQFHLYLVSLGLYKKSEIFETVEGFSAMIWHFDELDIKLFTRITTSKSGITVFLSFEDIKNKPHIAEKFYL